MGDNAIVPLTVVASWCLIEYDSSTRVPIRLAVRLMLAISGCPSIAVAVADAEPTPPGAMVTRPNCGLVACHWFARSRKARRSIS